MTNPEAKALLITCRPNGRDTARPEFAEALALAERDPELKTWWEAQQAFDTQVSAKFKQVAVPAGLRETILRGRPAAPKEKSHRLPYWLALAAMVMILAVAGLSISTSSAAPRLATATYEKSSLDFLGNDAPSLATMSENRDTLMAWLKAQHSPVGTLPQKMEPLTNIGCQTFQVEGRTVSLICFSLAGGEIVHLFMIKKGALTDPPAGTPHFQREGDWSTAAWSDADHSYLLATTAPIEKLKPLL